MEKFCFSSEKKIGFNFSPSEGGAQIFLEEHLPGKRRNKTTGRTGGSSSRALGITGWGKKKKKHWKMSFLSKLAPSPTGRAGKTNTKPRRIPEGASAPHIPLEIPQNLAWDQQLCPDPVTQQGAQSFPGKAGQEWEQPQLSEMGIPSWKRGVRRTESGIKKITRFGMFFHPGMMRGFRR